MSVFLEVPGGPELFVPTNTQARINCSVIKGYTVTWRVYLADRSRWGDIMIYREAYRNIGIEEVFNSGVRSSLLINASDANDMIEIICWTYRKGDINDFGTFGDPVLLIVYGMIN